MAEKAKLESLASAESAAPSEHLVIDLGKQKSKRVKALRRGEGKLMAEVEECLQGLKLDGAVAADAQTVIVVVERKRKGGAFPLMKL